MGERWTILVEGSTATVVDPDTGAVVAIGSSGGSPETAILAALRSARPDTSKDGAIVGFIDLTCSARKVSSGSVRWAGWSGDDALRDAVSRVAHVAAAALDSDDLDDVREAPAIEELRAAVRAWGQAEEAALLALSNPPVPPRDDGDWSHEQIGRLIDLQREAMRRKSYHVIGIVQAVLDAYVHWEEPDQDDLAQANRLLGRSS